MKTDLINEFERELQKSGISRRDALKLLGSSGLFLLANEEAKATTLHASDVKGKIVIIGGGLGGISTAARLTHALSNPDITVIEPNMKSVSYQPGNTFIGGGLYTKKDVMYNTKDFIPSGVNFIEAKAIEFDPNNNKVKLSNGETISYDYLVVAAGLVLDFAGIKGLEELGDIYTAQDSQKIINFFEGTGASTIYNMDAAEVTWRNMQKAISQAKTGKKINAIFTHPEGAVKCGGAPKKIMYLMNARLNEAGARENAELTFYAESGKMFGVKEYEEAIIKQFEARNMKYNLNHELKELDMKNKVATFDKTWQEKGPYDKDLEEYSMITKHMNVEASYDFIHVTPPMKAAPEIGNSEIGSAKGWVPVNKETLQHVKYNNIFALGDIAAVPIGKTGGSVRKQYKVLVDNLISVMEGKELTAKYNGYTVCPIITDIGKVMLAEFDYSMKPTPSFPLDPTQERYIWWLLKYYILKPMTQYGMLSGRA